MVFSDRAIGVSIAPSLLGGQTSTEWACGVRIVELEVREALPELRVRPGFHTHKVRDMGLGQQGATVRRLLGSRDVGCRLLLDGATV